MICQTKMPPMETVRYTYRLRPGTQALVALNAEWDRCRWVWNQCIARETELREDGYNTPSGYDLSAELTDWRARKEWLNTGSCNAQQNVVRKWNKARQAAFSGRGRPRFKSQHKALPSIEYMDRYFALRNNRLVLAKGITLPVVWHRALPSKPSSVVVHRDSENHWWASFVVRREPEVFPNATGEIGIDWGVITTATTTDPAFDLPHAQHGRRVASELARAQRKMSRRRRERHLGQSNGYKAARRQAARIHGRSARQRKHDARQWARSVVAAHDLIAVEDFRPKFLARSVMARKASDAAIGQAKRELILYGNRAGRRVVMVHPAYTSQTCGECGARTKLRLSDRTFACSICGHSADRDRNAARVILDRAKIDPAGVESVRRCSLSGDVQLEPESSRR